MGFKTYSVKVTNVVTSLGRSELAAMLFMLPGARRLGDRTAASEYEHEATFNESKMKFDSGDDYMVRISSNVKRVIKYKDKIVWFSEIKGHPDLDIALNLDIYRV
jgi:hypothetical protein